MRGKDVGRHDAAGSPLRHLRANASTARLAICQVDEGRDPARRRLRRFRGYCRYRVGPVDPVLCTRWTSTSRRHGTSIQRRAPPRQFGLRQRVEDAPSVGCAQRHHRCPWHVTGSLLGRTSLAPWRLPIVSIGWRGAAAALDRARSVRRRCRAHGLAHAPRRQPRGHRRCDRARAAAH